MTPIEKLVPEIVKALLENKLDALPLVYSWLASLVVGIVEKQIIIDKDQFLRWHQDTGRCAECERRGLVENDPRHNFTNQQWELNAISDFSISPSDYEEIKRRVGR